ncbi:hypothetical protein B7P43_G15890 [Cryptotermes secundus]|uniref:XRCC4 N-terminal domain-containing protein n=1 Tax=Cryptotermes secundus TaxID=105785 RepID=A0A2J7R6G9_9NEOP|nr:uncharacterized protein LOC111863102 isoform X2 [Cryptotermes secundus]PNF36435.1 hypothetical protein B7P43_G15890 [Cryptotermes secundus]
MNTTLSKLPEDGGCGCYRLLVEWNSYSFKVVLLQNGYAWNGHASHGHIEQLSQLLQLSVEEYMNETKLALSTQGGARHFTYLIEDGRFVWKKLDQCSKIRMKYGYIQLQETTYYEAAEVMLDSLLEQYCNIKMEADGLQKTNMVAERAGNKQPAVTERSIHEPVQDESSPDHYDSETDVEITDDERKTDRILLSVTDNLFDDDRKPLSTIPKRVSRPKRHVLESEAGPSSRKVTRTTVESGHTREFSSQDLLEDI